MALQSFTIDGARFRAGRWRARGDLAYLVPLSPAHTLTTGALAKAREALGSQGFDEIVTAAVAPPERAAFVRDGFEEREHLHLLRHDLTDLPPSRRRRPWRPGHRIERGTRADRAAVLDLDARTFDDFWHLDDDGLTDAMEATPVSRLRVIRDPGIVGYAVAGRAGTQGFLQRLAVDPDRQGSGLGSALVHDALHWMRRRGATIAWVNTQEANARALGLYEHLGFRPADHNLTVLARGQMRRSRAAAVAGLLVAVTAVTLPVATVTAQTPARLDLEAQTLFIDDDPAEIVLRVSGAPESARLRFTIHDDPVRTRAGVREHHRNPPTSGARIADFECTLDGDCREQATMTPGPDGIRTVTLDDLVGESLRSKVGALPLVVQLLDEDDDAVLDELVTSLIVLDNATPAVDGPHLVRLAFTSEVIAPLARQPDLRTSIDTDALLEAAGPLAAVPDLAVTTEIHAETLDALEATDPATLRELLEIIGGRPLMRGPWVDMDEEAWRLAGESDQVVSQYAIGNDTVERITGAPPTGIVRLDADAGPETLTLLRSAGATAVLVADDHLSPATRAVDPTQPFQLLDTNGVAITALRYDEALHETLGGDDPELAAYRAVAELTILSEEAATDQGVILDLDRISPEALGPMLDGVETRRALRVVDVDNLTQRELARVDGETLRGELAPTTPPDVGELAADLESATVGLATVALMVEPEVALLEPLIAQLQAAVSADLDPATASAFVDRVDQEIRDLSSGIEIADGDRITLTDRRTDLPLTIVNGQSLPLNVELLLTAEKLRFPDGDRLSLVLLPGDNLVTIPVETLASGDARVTATVVSPGGFFELGSGTVDIRSTAISGLGLVISIAALVVLGVWWIRTIRRVRRNRHAATVSAESAETPTEGEP